MCLEGGCGACIVAVERKNHVSKKITTQAINSVIVFLIFLTMSFGCLVFSATFFV